NACSTKLESRNLRRACAQSAREWLIIQRHVQNALEMLEKPGLGFVTLADFRSSHVKEAGVRGQRRTDGHIAWSLKKRSIHISVCRLIHSLSHTGRLPEHSVFGTQPSPNGAKERGE